MGDGHEAHEMKSAEQEEQDRRDEEERDALLLRREHALQVIANAVKLLPPGGEMTVAGMIVAGCSDLARRAL